MPQSYTAPTPTTTLQDSFRPLIDRGDAALSNLSGTSFPSAGLLVGMTCFRADQNKLYVLKQITPSVVWSPLLTQDVTDTVYLPLAGGVMTGDLTFDATTTQRNLYFRVPGGNLQFFARTSPTELGLFDSTNGYVWTYNSTANSFNFGNMTGGFTYNGNTIWHSGNDGSGSGLDADMVDGRDAAYLMAWSNITGKPSFSDAATTSVATIRAGVDVSSRLPLTGGTITGNLAISGGAVYSNYHRFLSNTDTGIDNSGSGQVSIVCAGAAAVTFSPGGAMTSALYGELGSHFALRLVAGGLGAASIFGNCGAVSLSYGYEVFDVGDGRHQLRRFASNCTNCTNCNCDCNCGM